MPTNRASALSALASANPRQREDRAGAVFGTLARRFHAGAPNFTLAHGSSVAMTSLKLHVKKRVARLVKLRAQLTGDEYDKNTMQWRLLLSVSIDLLMVRAERTVDGAVLAMLYAT